MTDRTSLSCRSATRLRLNDNDSMGCRGSGPYGVSTSLAKVSPRANLSPNRDALLLEVGSEETLISGVPCASRRRPRPGGVPRPLERGYWTTERVFAIGVLEVGDLGAALKRGNALFISGQPPFVVAVEVTPLEDNSSTIPSTSSTYQPARVASGLPAWSGEE
jgi:hypothetical protein